MQISESKRSVTVKLVNVTKMFGKLRAVDDVSLVISKGEFVTLLGPSGCGKTTLLRMIAGFLQPDKGEIFFNEVNVTNLPPWERNVGFVFQNYALWPNMSVFDNVAYGLKLRKLSRSVIREAVEQALELVGLTGIENKYPGELSGGMQQRVALARALVINPPLLLLDEPLSNLDAKLRVALRKEIRRIQKQLSITAIYVTHDQEEAFDISDRVVVLKSGRVQQIGKPDEIYKNPANLFVADFVGKANYLRGDLVEDEIVIEGFKPLRVKTYPGSVVQKKKVIVVVRPEEVKFALENEEWHCEGTVEDISFLGGLKRIVISTSSNIEILMETLEEPHVELNDHVYLRFERYALVPAEDNGGIS
ncbi:MAG: iron(III) transport system ATP-binding protein [Thermotogota bacterium]|nr:iron(III) transport system ATP-binding protein [Thermotogota bacterium]